MTTPIPFRLENVTVDDIPALIDLTYDAFSAPESRRLWPDTPGVRKWWAEANTRDLNKPARHFLKLVDPSSTDEQGRPRIVALAKWDLGTRDESPPNPPWSEDMDAQLCDGFFQSLGENRRQIMGDRKHYYLNMLCTHPDYQRRGAGSMLLKWGCDHADEEGVDSYVEASRAGAPLYKKFGFAVESESPGGDVAFMARRQPAL